MKNTKVVVINIFKSEDVETRDEALKEILIKHLSKEPFIHPSQSHPSEAAPEHWEQTT